MANHLLDIFTLKLLKFYPKRPNNGWADSANSMQKFDDQQRAARDSGNTELRRQVPDHQVAGIARVKGREKMLLDIDSVIEPELHRSLAAIAA